MPAAGTRQRHPQEYRSQRLHSIEVVLHLKLSRDGSTFTSGRIEPHVTGCDELIDGRIVQQVSRKLPRDEIIQRQVRVQREDHPVTIRVDAASIVEMQPVRVSVTNGVQPVPGLMFSVPWAFQ